MDFDVVGYAEDGSALYAPVSGADVMGRAGHHHHHAHHAPRHMALPPRPQWRNQLAPGVIQPDEGMVPMALAPQTNNGTYTSAINQITFQGQLQKPFRGERLLVSVVRTGASAVGRLLTQLFVGTDLQQGDITGWDAELIGQANAFGTRLTMKAAEPGVLVRAIVTLSSAITSTDTIQAQFLLLGRIVH
jgi:hypothetical protein